MSLLTDILSCYNQLLLHLSGKGIRMIDLGLLRTNPDWAKAAILKKDPQFNVSELIRLDALVRSLKLDVEALRHKKNELADQAKSGITQQIRGQSIEVGKKLKELEHQLHEVEDEFTKLYMSCPNIVMSDVPAGGKESNKVVKEVGAIPDFSFEPKNHLDLGNALGWFDFDAATRMTGSHFALYKGEAVKLIYALTMFMLKHNISKGYHVVLPPYLVNERSLEVTGNFPKFRDQVYHIQDDDLYLSPTAEVNLANMYRDQILEKEQLPLRMTSWTSCFRREAGGYGASERGLIRIHQFEKVELFTLSTPENADAAFEHMISTAEAIIQAFDIPYRISLLAAQDCSFPSAKTYDIEVWMPGQKQFYEVSSCSNCTDFQARRGLIRYKEDSSSKPQLVYTLNGSALALPRLLVAIMENYQQADGSIAIPSFLKEYGIW